MSFIHDDFLLDTEQAKILFHEYAKQMPIIDYHCHLSPREIATNHRWTDLADIWLGGDHYKWRAMRSNGVNERYCTGAASPRSVRTASSARSNGSASITMPGPPP